MEKYHTSRVTQYFVFLSRTGGCMLGGQPNHGWQVCFPLQLHVGGSDFRLYDGSYLKTCLSMRW